MFLDTEDTRYWESEAQDALSWKRVVREIKNDILRRHKEVINTDEMIDIYDDIDRADGHFMALYCNANAHLALARRGMTFNDLLA
ncbi:hypothetical protein ACWEOG_22365 [Amycolatopsis japonica]|uniref:hypothetical protein n=1 Tax=Amycolatopsis sp. NPDC049868 TaxID=3363934 RepID=UPI0037A000C3